MEMRCKGDAAITSAMDLNSRRNSNTGQSKGNEMTRHETELQGIGQGNGQVKQSIAVLRKGSEGT